MSRLGIVSIASLVGKPFTLDGLCAETDPEAFFPEKGENADAARQICNRCDVLEECREWALSTDERYGVWGGLSERERRAMKTRSVRS